MWRHRIIRGSAHGNFPCDELSPLRISECSYCPEGASVPTPGGPNGSDRSMRTTLSSVPGEEEASGVHTPTRQGPASSAGRDQPDYVCPWPHCHRISPVRTPVSSSVWWCNCSPHGDARSSRARTPLFDVLAEQCPAGREDPSCEDENADPWHEESCGPPVRVRCSFP